MKRNLVLAVVLGLLAACGGKSTPPPTGGSGVVSGFVTDLGSGAKLSGVTVQVVGGGQTATTDGTGAFTLSGLTEGKVKLSFFKSGYAPGYASIQTGDAASVLVTLKKEGKAQAYNPTTAQTLYQTTEAGPYAVIFQPGSLDTSDTNLKVVITPLDPTKESQALPGQLLAGSIPLLPVTFAEFSVFDSAGKRVNLKPSASAIVELPIPPDLRSTYKIGDKIHCYAYNPQTGQWEDFVEGTVEVSSVDGSTPVLRASIRHFSWYGGAPEGKKCYNGVVQVVDAGGKPLPGATVVVTPGVNGTTNAEGVASIWIPEGTTNPKMYAYKESTNADGQIPNLPRTAKIIDIGYFVLDRDGLGAVFPGLVSKDCASISSSSLPVHGPSAQAGKGTPSDPFVIKLAPVGQAVYRVTAILLADNSSAAAASVHRSATGGSLVVTVEQGIPNPDGELEAPTPVDGAKISLRDPSGNSADLTGVGQGSGSYYLQGGLALTPGTRYTLTIDADGNGSIDGSGSAYAVGNVAWDPALGGSTHPSSGFVAKWTDSASATPGYSAVYYAFLSNSSSDPNSLDFDYYVGPALQFTPHSNAQGATPTTPLRPGSYNGVLLAFSGAYSPAGNNSFTVSDNITGVGLSGQFYSYGNSGSGANVNFTLTP